MNLAAGKRALAAQVDQLAPLWVDLARRIHAEPELGLQERKASVWLGGLLRDCGFSVQHGIAGLSTALVARSPGAARAPRLAFLAEYDALPGLGHACGHNLIAAAAGLAASALARARPRQAVQVIGCPAEEFYGGKARLLARGFFKDVDAALMVHGYYLNLGARPTIGRASVILEFFGRAAHASTVPERGLNALDAMVQTFTGIGLLRQQIRAEARIHGIITHGGAAANIIPDYTRAELYVRSRDMDYLRLLKARVTAQAKAAALATGTRLKVSAEGYDFRPIRPNDVLARAYEENLRFVGEQVDALPPDNGTGSTDFGNVSHQVPALHGYFRVTPTEVRPHTPEFARACSSEAGLLGMVAGAKAMALTALDLVQRPPLWRAARQEFAQRQSGT